MPTNAPPTPISAPDSATGPAQSPRPDIAQARSVLSTLNDDGSRRWLNPRLSKGRFLTARRIVAYVLIAVFILLPLIRVKGKPLVLLDIAARRFHIFGQTFYPTDTLLLALLLVCVFLTIFWMTALLGRVWCGWACPQTVYMEFLFRPLERLFEGGAGRRRQGWLQTSGVGKPLKYAAYLACSFALAHVFLAYFVSWENLRLWVFGSPAHHTLGFGVIMLVTAAMMFNFGYFREQVCVVACPYGRMQSVMLDRHSMIVRYDSKRGEPRGAKASRAAVVELPVISNQPATAAPVGDCIDCKMCVTTCPTGIDIRQGLQMECIGCAQCIDACDAVMDKIHRPRGLIRYSSQAMMDGQKFRVMRPRVLLYPAVLLVLISLFTFVLLNTGLADVTLLRGFGQPFGTMPDGRIENNIRVKIVNRLEKAAEFTLAATGVEGVSITTEVPVITVLPGQAITVPAQLFVPRAALHSGRAQVTVVISGPEGFERRIAFTVLGPADSPPTPSTPGSAKP